MDSFVSLYLKKAIVNQEIVVMQIGVVFYKNKGFKYFHRYVANKNKKANNAIDVRKIINMLDGIIEDQKVILKNDNDFDFIYLNRAYLEFLNKPFTNQIYDVAKNAKFLNLKKTNFNALTNYYRIQIKNPDKLPNAVYNAQRLFLIGCEMFNLQYA